MNQRRFLAAGAMAAGSPLANPNCRLLYYGAEEQVQLLGLESRRPFRFGTAPDKSKVAAFENGWAARMRTKWALAMTSSIALRTGRPRDRHRRRSHSAGSGLVFELQHHYSKRRTAGLARRHSIRVLEDCSQSVGGAYKGKPLRSLRGIDTYSLQQAAIITAGEGGAVLTPDPLQKLSYMPAQNYRMNEFTDGVLLAQLRKLDSIVAAVRRNARRVYDGIADLPDVRLRRLPDPAGEPGTGVLLGFATKKERDRFSAGMKAEGVPVSAPGGSMILPVVPENELDVTFTPRWPSFAGEHGRAIGYGRDYCPRTIGILGRYAVVMIGPKYTQRDTDDAVAAIRRVYPAVMKA